MSKLPQLGWTIREYVDRIARSSPARLAIAVFASVIALFTALLSMPWATASGQRAPFIDALFTATSAVCVTGLTVVDTGVFWSSAGLVTIMLAIKVGGLGVMTLASILGMAVSRRIGLTQRMLTAPEVKADKLGEVGSLVGVVIVTSTILELLIATALTGRFLSLGESIGNAAWLGLFYAISSFNNAGFVPTPEGLQPYVADWFICIPIALGVFIGALGFPVILNIGRRLGAPSKWSLHSKLTLTTSSLLFLTGAFFIGVLEWANPETLAEHNGPTRLLIAIFSGVMPRSGGFSLVDPGSMHESTLVLNDALMFVGGGSASTGGGIKVTTFAVMLLAIAAEARGDPDVEAFGRRIPPSTLRLAVAVTIVGSIVVITATMILLGILRGTPYGALSRVVFEVCSAFGTVGLSTGITPYLPTSGKYVLTLCMFIGRTGTMSLAAALALRERRRVIRYPEERPIIG
jgi:trk system potassium uptake protein TrkH